MNSSRRLVLVLTAILMASAAGAQISEDHLVSPDKGDIDSFIGNTDVKGERKVYKGEELRTIGMPVGGICAGQLYVRGDGTLANWWIANNAYNTGYGVESLLNFDTPLGPWKVCYQTFEPMSYIDQGCVLTWDDGSGQQKKELSKKDFDDISFIGEYPIAEVNYASKEANLPLKVSAEFYSPYVPLEARRSATPATIMNYTVRNTSDKAVTFSLESRMQNLVCIDLRDKSTGILENRAVDNSASGWKSVLMSMRINNEPDSELENEYAGRKSVLYDDFESGTYSKWTVEGEAFGQKPSRGEQGNQDPIEGDYGRFLANSYTNLDLPTGKLTSKEFKIRYKYISFNIAGGTYPKETCMNLIVDGQVVCTATGNGNEDFQPRNWDVSKYKGKDAHFEIIDNAIGDWGHISVDNIEFSDRPVRTPLVPIDETHAYYGNLALSVFDPEATVSADILDNGSEKAEARLGKALTGSVASSATLAPGESRTVTFVLSWYFPNRPLSYKGSAWSRPLPPNSPAIGNMYSNWYNSSIDVAEDIHDNFKSIEADTHDFQDAYYRKTTYPYWLMQRIMMPASTLATETCQWWATDKFWAWEGVGSCEGTCTHVWGYAQAMAALFPELERNLREKTDLSVSLQEDGGILSRNGEFGVLIDGHASAILRVYREHLMSKNSYFLSRNWDKVKRAMEYMIAEDENEDGLIVKVQPNTFDIAFYGGNTYVGALYLAALRACEKMALVMNDQEAADRYRKIYTAGSVTTMDRLWNGEYFIQEVNEKEHPVSQYVRGCLSDQLYGQTWSDLLKLGDLYPADAIDKTLESIWKYNWTPDVGPQTELHLPERYYAHSGEPGLLVCTWPHEKHPGEAGVRYRDEVWTGEEYQVATGMIERGMVKEGLAIVRGIHSRYDGTKHNPWNEIECGDHYARAMASYGVLKAVEGWWYDGPSGIVEYFPRIAKDNAVGFFTAAEGWGDISQVRKDGVQENGIELRHGRLTLNKLRVGLEGKTAATCSATVNGKPVEASAAISDGTAEISFNNLILRKGDALTVTLR